MINRTHGIGSGRVPRVRRSYRERAWGPNLHRDRATHAPEEGLGGAAYWVHYHGENIGFVHSLWSLADGVHWQAAMADGHTIIRSREDRRPVAYASLADAVNALFLAIGLRGDYAP